MLFIWKLKDSRFYEGENISIPRCPICYPKNKTRAEVELKKYILSLNPNIKNNRKR